VGVVLSLRLPMKTCEMSLILQSLYCCHDCASQRRWVDYDENAVCRHVGGLLEFTDSQCCVFEHSDLSVTGYAITCHDASHYHNWFDETWLPSLKAKYPTLLPSDSDPKVRLSTVLCLWCILVLQIWNSIPLHIRQSQTYSSFRRHLKTRHYFLSAHLAP